MVDTIGQQTPSLVFPIPGYKGAIGAHGSYNGGSDIIAPIGDFVVSMVSGTVTFLSSVDGSVGIAAPGSGGNAVQIHGTDGKDYYYAHLLNPPKLGMNQSVLAGQIIGAVDTTGNAKGGPSHLHIGIGYGITTGIRTSADPSAGGLGQNFDAVSMLRALVADPRANNPNITNPDATPNPPQIQFDPSVPGFTSANLDGIKLNIERALAAGIDPFLWLGIVSKESTFDPNAKNPTSGACGYAQIYPCINLSPSDNIDEGIKRFKSFLASCNDNVNCALNLYSGGGGPLYASDVQARANSIKTANPSIATGGFSIPTIGGTVGTPGASQHLAPPEDCPPIKFGKIGLVDITIPNPACIVAFALKKMVTDMSNWWGKWQVEHIPAWTFVILGIVLIIIGGLALANSAGMQPPNISMPSGGGAASAAEVPAVAEVAAVA